MRVTKAVQRAGCAVFLGLAVATCRDGTGPGRGQRAYLALAPVLPVQAANLDAFGLSIDALRIVVVRPPADTVADRAVAFAIDLDSISLALSLTLAAPTEVFDVALELRAGGFVLFSATATVEVQAGGPGANEPLEIDSFVYTGPGADVTTLLVGPLDSVIRLGDSLRFRVNALADGIPVTQFYVSWSTDNETLAPINAAGVLRAPLQRGLALVTASTPTGVTGSALVTFIPLPVSVVPVGSVPQNVLPGVPIGPLRVQVLAADGLGVPGIPVMFRPVSGGGSVTNAVVVTDGEGFAATPAISGLAGITSVFSATVAGVAAPALFNITVLPTAGGTELAFAAPPTGGLVGVPFSVVVEVRDGQGKLVPTATDPVTVALGANPSGATLSGTTTVNAVAGVALFPALTLNRAGVGYTLVATAPGLTPDTSAPFAVLVGVSGRSWTNAAGGNWSNPANWSGGVVPGLNDTVFIELDGTYTVTLDVDATVAMLFLGGAAGAQTLTGVSRLLRVDTSATLLPTAVLALTNGTLAGTGVLSNQGTLRLQSVTVEPDLVNAGWLVARGSTVLDGLFANAPGGTTRVEADPFCCAAVLTVTDGFVNQGLLELTAVNGTGTTATLAVTNGTLVNALGATIVARAGTGGARLLNGELDNAGVLLVEHGLTLSPIGATHSNSGSIQVAGGDLGVVQSGTTPSFTTTGSIVVAAGRALNVSGGAFNYANPAPGGLAGFGAVTFSGTAVALGTDLAHDSVTLSFVTSTVTGPGTLINAAARTLTLQSSTITAPFVNQGLLVVRGASSLSGAVTAAGSGTIRLQADPFCCTSTLTVATGFTNNGVIELTAINGTGTTVTLDVTNGTLVNAPGATIAVLVGSGGARNLHAQLDNQGTLLVAHDVSLSEAEADHLNSGAIQLTSGNLSLAQSGTSPTFTTTGSIAVGAGRTLAVSGGTFQYANAVPGGIAGLGSVGFSGTTVALNSSLANDTVTLSFVNATVNGPGTLANALGRTLTVQQTAVNAPFANQGLLVVRGVSSLGGGVTTAAGSTLQLQADPFCCTSQLTVTGGFTNNGLIELTAINGTGATATLIVLSGFLVNAVGATIAIRAGSGGARNLQATVNNQGTVLVEQDVTLSAASADHVNGGTIQLTGGNLTVSQSGTTPTFSLTGSILLGAGRTLSVSGGAFNYSSVAPNGLVGPGAVSFSGTTVALATGLAPDAFNLSIVGGTVNGPGTLTNAAGRTVTVQTTTVNAPFVNQGLFVVRGPSALSGAVTASTGGTIRIQGDPSCCTATLSVASGFTNNGVMELTAVNGTGTTAALAVTAGPLVNAPGATISVLPGAGGGRILGALIENRGTLAIGQPLTLQRSITNFAAVKWTAGDVQVAGGATLDVQPAATFDVSSPGTWSGSGSPSPTIHIRDGAAMNVTTAGSTSIQSNTVLDIAGSLTLQSGATLKVAGDFNLLGPGGEVAGAGTLDVAGSPKVTNAGTLRPGGGTPGLLTIVAPPGTWPQGPGSKLVVDIAGTIPGLAYDQVVVLGAVTLGGTINVNRTVTGPPLTEYYPLTATVDIGGVLLPGNLGQLEPPMTLPLPDLNSTPKRVILLQLL